ncbi:PEP-CTERM sorting domain-containing protein [Tunturibacter psychrotolerans]|uniref:PEP-CTERM sorting domain-containing protein n=1 Tax=Tunturiibacter psychrotolerans TaxID=3069686 RepID=A0AAU7ZNH8_9BACT
MRLTILTFASLLALGSSPLLADPIPYANVGQLAPDHTFTATATGSVSAYFYSSDASNDDKIILWDKTSGAMTAPSLDNHSSAVGSSVSLSVKAGDSLIFILDDVTTGQYFSSVDYFGVASPANYNDDGYNHAYSTPYSGGVSGIPAGTYIGMEDLGVTGLKPLSGSDLDYNDDNFVFTNVAAAPTPEPSTFILFGTGLVAAASALRRKFARG